MRRDGLRGPLKIRHFPTGGRLTHSSTVFSLMTCLTAAVSRGSAEGEILLRRAFHDGFNCIKVAPLKSRSNFPIKRDAAATEASALSAPNVSENKASASLLTPSPVDGVDDVSGEEEQTVGLEGRLTPVWPGWVPSFRLRKDRL